MPYAVIGSSSQAKRFPFRRCLDILRGKVRWIPHSGWCEQNLFEIVATSIPDPTVEQIQFVQQQRPGLGNYLEIRVRLVEGERFGLGPFFSREEAAQHERTWGALKIPYKLVRSPLWRPLGFDPRKTEPNPQGGANGRQPFSSETNRTSTAAASRRSP
jgi:hypothetical protein